MLPFVSKRGIVRAADLMDAEAFENAQRYSDRLRLLIEALCAGVPRRHRQRPGRPHVRARRRARAAASGRPTSSTSTPSPPQSFPPTIGYGALGHLHRAQRIPAGPALHYCGSPLQLDFGEGEQPKQVNIVTIAPGVPADVRAVRLTAGRPLRTVRGSIDELAALDIDDDPWLRVVVRGERRAGLADDVRGCSDPASSTCGSTCPTAPSPHRPARPPRPQPAGAVRRVPAVAGRGRRPDRGAVRRAARRGARREAGPPRAGGLRRLPGRRRTVDFTDIELVALVGRTGSGKSTIIDAITFALYGSVARYDDNRAVAPVINQTSTRARVRLDFELGGRPLHRGPARPAARGTAPRRRRPGSSAATRCWPPTPGR